MRSGEYDSIRDNGKFCEAQKCFSVNLPLSHWHMNPQNMRVNTNIYIILPDNCVLHFTTENLATGITQPKKTNSVGWIQPFLQQQRSYSAVVFV